MSILDLTGIQASQPNASADVRTALLALESIGVQIGMSLPWDGTGDPAGGRFLLRDGRLIDKTTYADYFNAVGHAFNGGVDPGSNKVRIGDARGRVIAGADNMGTAQGAASRIVTATPTRGSSAGVERVTLALSEVPAHTHAQASENYVGVGGNFSGAANIAQTGLAFGIGQVGQSQGATTSQGGGASHQNLQPTEFTNYVVRVA